MRRAGPKDAGSFASYQAKRRAEALQRQKAARLERTNLARQIVRAATAEASPGAARRGVLAFCNVTTLGSGIRND